ncbi:flagellar hook protein FlgE [Kozakia baliensis]|uniref:flagellar hook protein FlgE n=1 Tax=Kozakia baliensis TaxID=153496 RepID=UPI000495C29C|nr:flagellar hook protein FlgE [Kozakia baliensis]AOX20795.1 flagellar biosynthesis protein FlgE [Kozakia baliensis]
MSIFGSVTTAVSGLNAQSKAFSNLSNNIANSQTTGYKASDTAFQDFVTNDQNYTNDASGNDSVAAHTVQRNDVQGTVTQSTNDLALAISGNGFFNVQEVAGNANSATPSFNTQQYYTRNGDFSRNAQGYLVNTSGAFLDGYQVGADGAMSTKLAPIQIKDVAFQPTQSSMLSVSGAIGSTTKAGASSATQGTAYDASGKAQTVKLNWQQDSQDPLQWTVSADGSDKSTAVSFSNDGALASVGGISTIGATGKFTYDGKPQNMTVDLGTIGGNGGVSLTTGSTPVTGSATMNSDSVTSGNFQGLAMRSDGSVMASFDNGQSQLVAKIPIATFANVNGLSPQDGQNYIATSASGSATQNSVGTGGAGALDTGSVESSTTDLTSDLSQLIVAQQAYGANTKVVTTANQLMQTTIAMIQ